MSSYHDASFYSFLSFDWVNPVVETGTNRQIRAADAPKFGPVEDTVTNSHLLLGKLEECENSRRNHPLLKAVCFAYKWEITIRQTLAIIGHLLGLLNPLLIQQVLIFQEAQNGKGETLTEADVQMGKVAVGLLIFHGLFMIFFNSQVSFFQNRVSIRIGSALRGAVLLRCVRGNQPRPFSGFSGTLAPASDRGGGVEDEETDFLEAGYVRPEPSSGGNTQASAAAPTVYNVISFDIGPNIDIIWIILGIWLFPIQFLSTMGVLFHQVSWAAFPGLGVIIVVKLLTFVFLYRDGILRDKLLAAKDMRLGRCNEGFNNIRTLQMLSWVTPYQEKIMSARGEELRVQNLRLWMTKMVAAMDYSLPALVTFATLWYYVVNMGGELKASIALPVIGLVTSLSGPFGQFPTWLNQYLCWRSAYDRVNTYMEIDVYPGEGDGGSPTQPGSPSGTTRSTGPDYNAANFQACTLSWGVPRTSFVTDAESRPLIEAERGFMLQDLDMNVRCGELTVLIGLEGEGKSSLLLSLLGEMAVEGGTVTSPAILRRYMETENGACTRLLPATIPEARALENNESSSVVGSTAITSLAVPYSAQSAMLFTGTVRWNILFGCPYDAVTYEKTLRACALEDELAVMPAGDLTDVAQGGNTLSGGQRARMGLARAVYRAAYSIRFGAASSAPPLVLLDDPFCALDPQVSREICAGLFAIPEGMLAGCAVIVSTADPWWIRNLPGTQPRAVPTSQMVETRAMLIRGGRIVASTRASELQGLARGGDFPELKSLLDERPMHAVTSALPQPAPFTDDSVQQKNPQDEEAESEHGGTTGPGNTAKLIWPRTQKLACAQTQTAFSEAQKEVGTVIKEEHRESGHVKYETYVEYLSAVGWGTLFATAISLSGIMIFQAAGAMWIAYWTEEHKENSWLHKYLLKFTDKPPEDPATLLKVYGIIAVCFTMFNFAGHGFEIIGGMGAARKIFAEALHGTFDKPFRWWDANPTGRVLNRFSEDVEVMDLAVTNIFGIILGAVLFFIGHSAILAIANPASLLFIPFIAFGLEYYARYYRNTIREVQRLWLVSMSTVYQDMVEAILGKVTVRAFASTGQVLCKSMEGLETFQQFAFLKSSVQLWLGLRMSLIGYTLTVFNKLYPILQYFGYLAPQSAALVGFSIEYSSQTVGIIQQFIMNFSDLEMQLVSIERLREFAKPVEEDSVSVLARGASVFSGSRGRGLRLLDVTVTYRTGLRPALAGVSLRFTPREVVAIMGRTGAGKSSLLLAVLQLVPHTGTVEIDGQDLRQLAPGDVRRRLVGVVPQHAVIFDGDVRFNLDPEGCRSDAELWEALQAVGLKAACREKRGGLATAVVSNTSGGGADKLALSQSRQQLLCAARALLRSPRVALLDEVTASLQGDAAAATVDTLVNRFKTKDAVVMMITHQAKLVESCDRVVTIAGGRVVEDRRVTDGRVLV